MSHPDQATRTKKPEPAELSQLAQPVRRVMTVGAADDHAELDADRRADAALGWLAGQQPLDQQSSQPHVHDASCGIGRSHAASGEATIGYAGGELDEGTQSEIESAKGGGEALHGPLRGAMEGAFGADLGKVRLHRGAQAAKISRSISAEAFTTGNDIFFGAGAYDPASPRGQRVLAHELGHVMQGRSSVQRLFGRKKKDANAAPTRKDQVKEARATNTAKDKSVRQEAKGVNAQHKALTAQIKLTYEVDPSAKLLTPPDLAKLQARFANKLKLEAQVRAAVKRDNPQAKPADLERMQEEAAENVWATAAPEIRALRPMRFDEFDKAMNEVAEMAREGRGELEGRSAYELEQNEASFGAPMDPSKASKKVLEQRALDRRQARIQEGDSEEKKAAETKKSLEKGDKAVGKAGDGVGPRQDSRLRQNAVQKRQEAKFGKDTGLDDGASGVKTAGTVFGGLGTGEKSVTKQVVKKGMAKKTDVGVEASDVVGASANGLGALLSMVGEILSFISQISEIKKGAADKHATTKAVQQGAKVLNNATSVTKTTLLAAKEGVEAFGPAGSIVLSQVKTALPIVGLITSAIGVIDGTLEALPHVDRHAVGVVSVEEALLGAKAPLAAAYDRVNSRTAQLIEQSAFKIAKNCTMLGLNIAEVASAGGFAVPMAAKTAVSVVDLLHTVGHKIYDTVGESKSSTALKDFKVKHKEGASRDVLKYDVGSGVDVIIVAAKKHKLAYARMTLAEYGVKENEIDSMWLDEIREKVLDYLDSTGDPKTVKEKVDGVKESVKEALGVEKTPTGMGEEKTTLQTIASIPGKVGGAIAGLPGKIRDGYRGMKEKYADAKMLVEKKNETGYSGKNERGTGSAVYHFLRGGEKNEKALANVRTVMADRGTAHGDLPRTTADRKKRAEIDAKRDTQPDPGIGKPVLLDNAFVQAVTKATSQELFDMVSKIKDDPDLDHGMAKMRFIELEVQARITQPGAKAMPGARG